MVDHTLAVVVFPSGDDVPYIATLDGGITVVDHELVRLLHVTLIVPYRAGSLVVHDELHALALGIITELSDVEVGVRGDEVKYSVLAMTEPILPSDIPSFDQDSIEAVLGCEVDVLLHMLRVGSMLTIGANLGVVGLSDLHVR